MVDIMHHLHQYVPCIKHLEEKVISTGEKVVLTKESRHRILFGGDQRTAARARSAIRAKANSETPSKRLEGLIHRVLKTGTRRPILWDKLVKT